VLSVSTESRDLSEDEIVHRMRLLAEKAGGARLILKKIDSTLRGNVNAEIAAAMEAFQCATAVVTPAFPDMGRTVLRGHLHINGVPTRHAGENVLDAVTNQDLDQIVEDGLKLSGRILWAGSAGLATALARRLYGAPKPLAAPCIGGSIAFCIGSNHPATRAQQIELRRHRPDAKLVAICRNRTPEEEIRSAVAGAAALFITGGDTASMVLRAVGARSIAIQHEVVTGVPWGLLSGGMFDGCPVVTKSGGFGASDTLIRVADFFKCQTQ
jgi:D-threonate/D-erythronate kinase